METDQIDSILRSDKYVMDMNFLGVFPRDKLPTKAISLHPCCAVVNTQPHTERGMHWVCFMKSPTNHGYYFDSYGNPPYNLVEVSAILDSCDSWTFNETQLQTSFSTVCGQYTIFALTYLARGYNLKQIASLINDCGDTYANDALVFSYINNKYHQYSLTNKLKIVDAPFVLQNTSEILNKYA